MLALIVSQGAFAAEPPPGILEYLGAMVESGGVLIDPLALAAVPDDVILESAEPPPSKVSPAETLGVDATPDQAPVSKEEGR